MSNSGGKRQVKELESLANRAVQHNRKVATELYIQAAGIIHQLGPDFSSNYRARLARSLAHLGYSFIQSKDHHLARNAYTEASSLYRVLYISDPTVYRPDFASSLHNLGIALNELKLYPEAQNPLRHAIKLQRSLYASDPEAYCAHLANALHRFGFALNEVKLYTEARDAYREAVELRRQMYTSEPDTYRVDLAYSLYNLGIVFKKLEFYSEARDVFRQSIQLRRVLYTSNPNTYRTDLVYSLHNLGIVLNELKLYSEAQHLFREVTAFYQVLYASNANMYCAPLANALHGLGISLDSLNIRIEARDAYSGAVDLRRMLYTSDPSTYRVDLAYSLHGLGFTLHKLKLYSVAQDAYQEAIKLRRMLYASHPDTHRANLSYSLQHLAFALDELRFYAEARDAYREAVELFRVLYICDPDTYRLPLTQAMDYLASANDNVSHDTPSPLIEPRGVTQEARIVRGAPKPSSVSQASSPDSLTPTQSSLYPRRAADEKRSPLMFEDHMGAEEGVPSQFSRPPIDDASNDEPSALINVTWVPQPASRGGYALVFRGTWNGYPVALKQLHSSKKAEKLQKRIRRESLIWQRQKHRNILPFLGIFTDSNNPNNFVYMISPWRENGNLQHFLEKHHDANLVDMIYGVACALEYLHGQSPVVVHGDLRAANILVSEDHIPQLADFGLASLVHDSADGEPGLLFADTSTANRGGACRWQAPELLGEDDVEERPRFTPESDIYSFAMVIIEIFTDMVPFGHVSQDHRVPGLVGQGTRPPRPNNARLSDGLWECMNQCWVQEPKERLLARQVVPVLRRLQ